MTKSTWSVAAVMGMAVLIGGAIAAPRWMRRSHAAPSASEAPVSTSTSRADLVSTIARLERRLTAKPTDERAAVGLADALMRQARVTGDASLATRAEAVLKSSIRATDGYGARRMLGVVYLSQHRFREALDAGQAAKRLRPEDTWNDGVIGDASIELGLYDRAFAAFDRMAARRPNAGAYARVAYARELQGDLDGAMRAMSMTAEATSAHDPEGQAWAWAQIGNLQFQRGALGSEQDRHYRVQSRNRFV